MPSSQFKVERGAWQNMIQRCKNPKNISWKHYGGRGIKVCKRWRNSFQAFLEDMGPKPAAHLTLERRNNDGHYTPDNCCWATRRDQNFNRSAFKTKPKVKNSKKRAGPKYTVLSWVSPLGTKKSMRVRSL